MRGSPSSAPTAQPSNIDLPAYLQQKIADIRFFSSIRLLKAAEHRVEAASRQQRRINRQRNLRRTPYHSHCFRSELVHVDDVLRDSRLVVVYVQFPPVDDHDRGAPWLRQQRLHHAASDLTGCSQNRSCKPSHGCPRLAMQVVSEGGLSVGSIWAARSSCSKGYRWLYVREGGLLRS